MLILKRFNLELHRLDKDSLEIVRQGRNQDFVRENHVYKKVISKEEQIEWFKSINNKHHYYFVVVSKQKKVGVVYASHLDEDLLTSSCGVFMWDKLALSSRIPILAAFAALDFFFHTLQLESTETIVLKSNTAAVKMDKFLGYQFEDLPGESHYKVTMSRSDFERRRKVLIPFALRLTKDKSVQELDLVGEPSERNLEAINTLLRGLKK